MKILGTQYTEKRAIEIWCVLNAKQTPTDLPAGNTPDDVFIAIGKQIPLSDRLKFWNSEAFNHSLHVRNFISP